MKINYRSGYKYQLVDTVEIFVGIFPDENIVTQFLILTTAGVLIINSGYAWDGPSGPTIDTESGMRASLIHDAIYQLIREDKIDKSYRKTADVLLYEICREDGMPWWRANSWYMGVRAFGAKHTEAA